VPYHESGSDVPSSVPSSKRHQFAVVWNAAYREYQDEGRAFATAWAAIKKSIDDELNDLIDEAEDDKISKLIRSIEERFGIVI
jgi:hypothetical protein